MLCCGTIDSYSAEAAKRDTVVYYEKAKGLFHLRARTDISSSNFAFSGGGGDEPSVTIATSSPTRIKQNIGVGLGPLFLNFGIALNGKNPDTNLGFNIYGKMVSFMFNYAHHNSMSGKGSVIADQVLDINAGSMYHNCLQANLLITPNGKRFSLPAAMNQNIIQKRSAGSIFICLNGTALNALNRKDADWPFPDVSVDNLSLGAGLGYGYNWVPVERLLVHASLMAVPGFIHSTWTTIDGVQHKYKGATTADISGNLACVYHFRKNFYVGAYASFDRIFTLSSTSQYLITRGKSDAHVALGVRF